MNETILECKGLCLGYGSHKVIENLNFEVHQGDYLCIVGENGSGKSTLMKTILGLQSPILGNIEYKNGLKKNEIGYLPQQTVIQKDFPASVYEIVVSGNLGKCGIRPFYNKKEKELALANIKKMNIENLTHRCYMELSGGQQQRVLLARALCATSKVLLLDEPVTGLDPNTQIEMYELIKTLNKEGITIIMISHDMNNALDSASHILHIGNDIFFGTKEDFIKNTTKEEK
jgi:zinc transport system ATP-binding protein